MLAFANSLGRIVVLVIRLLSGTPNYRQLKQRHIICADPMPAAAQASQVCCRAGMHFVLLFFADNCTIHNSSSL